MTNTTNYIYVNLWNNSIENVRFPREALAITEGSDLAL